MKINMNIDSYQAVLNHLKTKFDSIPKFDPKLGILNVYQPLVVDIPLYQLKNYNLYKTEDLEEILVIMRSKRLIDNFTLDSKQEKFYHINFNSGFDQRPDVKALDKTTLYISHKDGIYVDLISKNPTYQFKKLKNKNSKRKVLVMILCQHSKKSGKELMALLGKSASGLSNEIREVNEKFKSTLGSNFDLIIRADGGGYELNRNNFTIINQT